MQYSGVCSNCCENFDDKIPKTIGLAASNLCLSCERKYSKEYSSLMSVVFKESSLSFCECVEKQVQIIDHLNKKYKLQK